MSKLFIAEAIGTFFLVFTILVATGYTQGAGVYAPFAIAGALMFSIFALGQISGGHFNPAVSIAATVRGALDVKKLPWYILAQLLGAGIACLIALYFVNITQFKFSITPVTPLVLSGTILTVPALIGEFVFTFALCFTVLMVATNANTKNNSYYGLAIATVVFVGAMSVGKLSGGAFNPAVALMPTLANYKALTTDVAMNLIFVYLLPQIVAAVLAGFTYKFMFDEFKVNLG